MPSSLATGRAAGSIEGRVRWLEGTSVNADRSAPSARRYRRGLRVGQALLLSLASACSNNPYLEGDEARDVLYQAYSEAPKTLDPAVGYSTADHEITGEVFETLLGYEYLKRPYELAPSLAEEVPEAEPLEGGRVRYRLRLREDLRYQKDPVFSLRRDGSARYAEDGARRILASDFVFSIQRIFDAEVGSPVPEPFSHIDGLAEFGRRLSAARKADSTYAQLPISEQYRRVGPVVGLSAPTDRELEIVLSQPYPQLLYWLAMPFSSPLAFEAVEYYDGKEGRPPLSEHPVGSGPFMLTLYAKRARMVLDRNPDWYGARRPEKDAPLAQFPQALEAPNLSESEIGRLGKLGGRILPLVDRIDYRREEESIPAFNKFLQGYYDLSGIIRESFDRVIDRGGLSEDMTSRGMRLDKSVEPAVYYLGFNLDDEVVGSPGGERARLLRQAMSLATDVGEYLRIFLNGRGIPAESPLPPGLFGYDETYRNPFRKVNLDKARVLLEQAGYPGGIDPATKRPLRLTFDVPDTSPEARVRFVFWTNQWRKLGIDVVLSATNYNKFQEKVRDGAYQVFPWGWVADYPDPENFLFLLTGPMARSVSGGPNSANFKNAEYDALFERMKTMENGPERLELIRQMRTISERERPWIELFHPEKYALLHGWLEGLKPMGLSVPTKKYYAVDSNARAAARESWNRPILWPAYLLVLLVALFIFPAIRTFFKERQ